MLVVTSEQEGFAAVVKSSHLGNSISGICQVKFADYINLVILIWSETKSWTEREMKVRETNLIMNKYKA